MRWVIVVVLPVPAPARMQTGPRIVRTASRCSSLRPSRASARTAVAVPVSIAPEGNSALRQQRGASVPLGCPTTGRRTRMSDYFSTDKASGAAMRVVRGGEHPTITLTAGIAGGALLGERLNILIVTLDPNATAPAHAHDEDQLRFI